MQSLVFLMIDVLTAATAELFELETFGRSLLVLCSYVVPTLALDALQYDIVTRHKFKSPKSIPQYPTPCRRRQFCHLHESRSANPFPWQSARSARCSSPRCHRASPSQHLLVSAPLPSRPSSESKTAAGSQ